MLAMILLFALFELKLAPIAHSALVNVTVDDFSPEISYFPNATEAGWSPVSLPREPCGGCAVSFGDPDRLSNRTYHDGTSNRQTRENVLGLNFTFVGTAIYAQLVVPGNDHPGIDRLDSEYYFYIDGERVGEYAKSAPDLSQTSDNPNNAYLFNHTVYANDTLPNGTHVFSLQAGRVGGPEALVLFDSLIYTHLEEDDTPTSDPPKPSDPPGPAGGQRSTNMLTIILATVIPIVVLSILFTLCFLLHRRQRRARQALEQERRNAVAQWEQDRCNNAFPGGEIVGMGPYSRPPSYTSNDGLSGARGGGMVMRWLSLSARTAEQAERANTSTRRSDKGGRM